MAEKVRLLGTSRAAPAPQWPGEVCKRCKRRSPIGFSVPDDVWAAVVGDPGTTLCPACFDVAAQKKGVRYSFVATYSTSWSDWDTQADYSVRIEARPLIAALDAAIEIQQHLPSAARSEFRKRLLQVSKSRHGLAQVVSCQPDRGAAGRAAQETVLLLPSESLERLLYSVATGGAGNLGGDVVGKGHGKRPPRKASVRQLAAETEQASRAP
jgi:hypothetical protein